MVPLNMEDEIRKRMEDRSIKPSDSAWERLESRLESLEKKPVKKRFGWLNIAAAIGTLALLSFWLWNTGSKEAEGIKMVDSPVEKPVNEDNTPNAIENQTIPAEELNIQEASEIVSASLEDKKDIIQQKESSSQSVSQTFLKTSDPLVKNDEDPKEKLSTVEKSMLDENVVPEFNSALADLTSVDKEVDSLLNAALAGLQKDAATFKTDKIDATALLNAVEDDLEKSFRERVFKALVSGVENVRTAVAERNN